MPILIKKVPYTGIWATSKDKELAEEYNLKRQKPMKDAKEIRGKFASLPNLTPTHVSNFNIIKTLKIVDDVDVLTLKYLLETWANSERECDVCQLVRTDKECINLNQACYNSEKTRVRSFIGEVYFLNNNNLQKTIQFIEDHKLKYPNDYVSRRYHEQGLCDDFLAREACRRKFEEAKQKYILRLPDCFIRTTLEGICV